jgi:hypothetical protein
MSSYEFPISDTLPCPPIGSGFDLIAGTPLDYAALDGDDSALLRFTEVDAGDSQFAMTRDTASYTQAISKQLDVSGSGWGASVGLSLSESSFSATNSSAVTINLDAFESPRQSIVKADAPLLQKAMELLRSDPAAFALKYGSHFVAGYIYGKRCSLAYNMRFSSEEEKTSFSAKLTASYSGVDFSASMSAAISTAQTSSKANFSTSTVHRYAGFSGGIPATLEDIDQVRKDYKAAPAGEATPIKLIVMPWHYLTVVDDNAGLVSNPDLDTLVGVVNKLGYVMRSCGAYLDAGLYAGHSQLAAIQAVKADAQAEFEAIGDFLKLINRTGTPVTAADVARFPDVAPLLDRMNFALTSFVLAFKVQIAKDDDDCNSFINDIDGQQFMLDGKLFDGSKGCYLDWSLKGNDGWAGTIGTTTMVHTIARTIKNGGLTAAIHVILDRDAGTLQIWRGGQGETLDQNARSQPVKIRGSVNARVCDDPDNHSGIINWSGGHDLKVSAAAI